MTEEIIGWNFSGSNVGLPSGEQMKEKPRPEFEKYGEHFKAYEDGKHRRYTLLFTVNGGAFAIAKLFDDHSSDHFLGNLTRNEVSLGMIFFTMVMCFDILSFGLRMRWEAEQQYGVRWKWYEGIFNRIGLLVLISLGVLSILGWLLVIKDWSTLWPWWLHP